MDAAQHRHDAIAAAWASVRFIIGVVFNLFGAPSEIASLRLLPRRWRAEIVAWLRPAEALVRRLLLVRAAELAPGLTLPESLAAARRSRGTLAKRHPERAVPEDDSASWRGIHFRILLPPRHRRAVRKPRGQARPFLAAALAERLEALIRATQASDRLALRLARWLTAHRPGPGADADHDPVGRLLRPTIDTPDNPARLAMKRLAPLTDEADRFFSSA